MSAFSGWLFRASLQASVLTVIVLAVQWAFQKKLSARWRYAFWFLALAKLALPFPPASPFSLFNYVRMEKMIARAPAIPLASGRAAGTIHRPPAAANPSMAGEGWFRRENVTNLGGLIWALGVVFFATRTFMRNRSFRRLLGTPPEVSDRQTLALFTSCKAELGVTAPVRLCKTGLVKSPALHGFGRPRLLLPAGILDQFGPAELRHIFLHELAHVKRRDMDVLWLVTFWKITHWFNPVLWFGFRRMAEDRELACDELALSHAGERESGRYGETILKLLESHARPAAAPGLLGILEDKVQVRRRILLIAQFKSRARRPVPIALLLLAVGLVTLTDAQPEKPASVQKIPAIAHTWTEGTMAGVAGSRDTLEQGARILRLLAASDPGNADWHRDLNDSLEKLDGMLLAQGNRGGAQAFVEQGIKMLREMIDYLYAPTRDEAARESGFGDPWDD